jgi:hypothetical protein
MCQSVLLPPCRAVVYSTRCSFAVRSRCFRPPAVLSMGISSTYLRPAVFCTRALHCANAPERSMHPNEYFAGYLNSQRDSGPPRIRRSPAVVADRTQQRFRDSGFVISMPVFRTSVSRVDGSYFTLAHAHARTSAHVRVRNPFTAHSVGQISLENQTIIRFGMHRRSAHSVAEKKIPL